MPYVQRLLNKILVLVPSLGYETHMLVLGIDPGTRLLGWGVVRVTGRRMIHIGHGVIRAGEKRPLSSRLLVLSNELASVIECYRPDVGAVESLFFHKDAQAAAKLGHARGVVLLTLERFAVPMAEYAPARVKSMVTGSGRAEKGQVARMVSMLLGLEEIPPADAADALAIAVTHVRRAPVARQLLRDDPGRERNTELLKVLGEARRRPRRGL